MPMPMASRPPVAVATSAPPLPLAKIQRPAAQPTLIASVMTPSPSSPLTLANTTRAHGPLEPMIISATLTTAHQKTPDCLPVMVPQLA